jgi:hypothetical protein
MLDLDIGSLHALSLEALVYRLVAMAFCIVAIALIGFDGIIVAIVVRYAIPIFAELCRRGWRRVRSRLCGQE